MVDGELQLEDGAAGETGAKSGVAATDVPSHGGLDAPASTGIRAATTTSREEPGSGVYTIPSTLSQRYMEVPCKMRAVALLAYISSKCRHSARTKMVVFLSSCDTVDFAHWLATHVFPKCLEAELTPVPILKLHGNMPQSDRYASFLSFQKHTSAVLLCTDVAARGLDFPEVNSILQFDPPGAVAEYVHRVGRTARMGRKGDAMLFLLPSEMEYAGLLQQSGAHIEPEPLKPCLDALPVHREMQVPRTKGTQWQPDSHPLAIDMLHRLTEAVANEPDSKSLSQAAFRTFVRAYSTHPRELKPIFHPKRLHLGHLAHGFCLRDTPTMMGQSASKAEKVRRQKEAAQRGNKNKRKLHGRGHAGEVHRGAGKMQRRSPGGDLASKGR